MQQHCLHAGVGGPLCSPALHPILRLVRLDSRCSSNSSSNSKERKMSRWHAATPLCGRVKGPLCRPAFQPSLKLVRPDSRGSSNNSSSHSRQGHVSGTQPYCSCDSVGSPCTGLPLSSTVSCTWLQWRTPAAAPVIQSIGHCGRSKHTDALSRLLAAACYRACTQQPTKPTCNAARSLHPTLHIRCGSSSSTSCGATLGSCCSAAGPIVPVNSSRVMPGNAASACSEPGCGLVGSNGRFGVVGAVRQRRDDSLSVDGNGCVGRPPSCSAVSPANQQQPDNMLQSSCRCL
jgi:hypothetical protein